jgi:hypothetical protein
VIAVFVRHLLRCEHPQPKLDREPKTYARKHEGRVHRGEFTAVFRKVSEGYIGFVEELPGANT